ncbi:putative F-box/FBD/LRR-repeat protein At2g05300 [Rutidosis leptorrhynchoides]|uniref:putative F-box/FBD/LRR-repeat protein At2g05300 n=1 Tax=Rutidosis leptorrhynchoides TaxID=125765 RepID=UPI003A9A3B30
MGKHSYADDNSAQGIDMISQLPDELLIRILSLLPAADVTRSRILSNRWKHLWAFLPNLHFVMPKFKEHANKFYDTVHQVLALRGGPGAIVIPELEITFKCLKKFNLQDIKLFDENSLTNLISWCPVLEELCLDRLQLTHKSHIVKLSSSSIRRLTIKRSLFEDRELVIDVPKLECLQLLSCYVREYTLMSPTSLVETHITNTSDVIMLLIFASSTKILRLISEYLLGIGGIWNINLPMYPYLVKLEIA